VRTRSRVCKPRPLSYRRAIGFSSAARCARDRVHTIQRAGIRCRRRRECGLQCGSQPDAGESLDQKPLLREVGSWPIARIGRILIGWKNDRCTRTMPGCKAAAKPTWAVSDSRESDRYANANIRTRLLRNVGFPGAFRLCCRASLPGVMGTHFGADKRGLRPLRGHLRRSRRISAIGESTFPDARAFRVEQRLGPCHARQLLAPEKQPPGGYCLAREEPTVHPGLQQLGRTFHMREGALDCSRPASGQHHRWSGDRNRDDRVWRDRRPSRGRGEDRSSGRRNCRARRGGRNNLVPFSASKPLATRAR
jgi:hypothetical protein